MVFERGERVFYTPAKQSVEIARVRRWPRGVDYEIRLSNRILMPARAEELRALRD